MHEENGGAAQADERFQGLHLFLASNRERGFGLEEREYQASDADGLELRGIQRWPKSSFKPSSVVAVALPLLPPRPAAMGMRFLGGASRRRRFCFSQKRRGGAEDEVA